MGYSSAFIYGLIQGVTEFLPISSSGHLALLPHFFHWKDPGVSFDLAMHVGTACAVLVYFVKDISLLIKDFFANLKLSFQNKSIQHFYSFNLFLAIIGTVIFALLLRPLAFLYGRNPQLIALNLIFFGVCMWAADRLGPINKINMGQKQWVRSLLIGSCQALALFPGVSRSGVTLSISRFLGIERKEATRFSFLLSAPIIFGGALAFVKDFKGHLHDVEMGVVIFGGFISFIIGFLTIHFFLKIVGKFGLGAFALYRIFAGLIVLYFLGGK